MEGRKTRREKSGRGRECEVNQVAEQKKKDARAMDATRVKD